MATRIPIIALLLFFDPIHLPATEEPVIPAESPAEAKARHERVAERRKGTGIICHRGASELAHENTLEAYPRDVRARRATATSSTSAPPGTACSSIFHDDMLDRLLDAYGDVSDYTWAGTAALPFPQSGRVRRAMPHPHACRGASNFTANTRG